MPATDAERQSVIADWTKWLSQYGSAIVDQGNPFTPMVKNISSDGRVNDGPTGAMPSGYSVIKANSMDAAVAIARSCPVLKGGAAISVFETFNAMGGEMP